jgi:hypothetical protein
MEKKHRDFLDKMMRDCKTHDKWLTIVNFGLPTLLKDRDVLIELIVNEASRISDDPTRIAGIWQILGELNLHLEVAS